MQITAIFYDEPPLTSWSRKVQRSQTGSMITRLSDDLVLHVFSFLDATMLSRVCGLSTRYASISSEDMLWYTLLRREFGEARLPAPPKLVVRTGEWRRRWMAWRKLESCGCETRAVSEDRDEAPAARFLHRAACPTGRSMYIFGGEGEDGEFNDMWVLDKKIALSSCNAPGSPAAGRRKAWRRVCCPPGQPAPHKRLSATLTAVGGRLLLFGGNGFGVFLNDSWIYDIASSSWECIVELGDVVTAPPDTHPHGQRPCRRWAHSAVAFGRRVLIFGGSAPGRCFNDLHWFDLDEKMFTPVVPEGAEPLARSGHCACAVGDADNPSMFIFEGNTYLDSFNDLWEFEVLCNRWRQVLGTGLPPSGRVGHTITSIGSRLLILGGREFSTNQFDTCLHAFDRGTKRWAQVPLLRTASRSGESEPPILRTGHSTDAYEGKLLVFGGLCNDGSFLGDVTSVNLLTC